MRSSPAVASLLLLCSCALDTDIGAHSQAGGSIPYVPPNPRVAHSIGGNLDVAILFVQLTDGLPIEVDPDDIQTTFGSVSGGVGVPGGDDPGFITVAEYYQIVSHDTVRLHDHVFAETVSLRGTPRDYCRYENQLGGQDCDVEELFADALAAAEAELDFEADDYDAFAVYVGGVGFPGFASRTWGYDGVDRRGSLYGARERTLGWDANPNDVSYKSLLIHELGHALGDLEHAGIWFCIPEIVGSTPLDPPASCTVYKADPFSPMGANGVRGLSAYDRNLWGFVDESQVYWAWPSAGHFQTVELTAIEVSAPTSYQEIRIPLASGTSDFYSVEYVRPIGVDAAPLTASETTDFPDLDAGDSLDGLLIRLRADSLDPDDPGEALILSQLVTPSSPFYDPHSHISIALTPLAGNRARVHLGINVAMIDP
jgi:hypothetical protein